MSSEYYIMHEPSTFFLMKLHGEIKSPLDILSFLTNKDASFLSQDNFLEFLKFDAEKRKVSMMDTFGIESYASYYIANQIARIKPDSQIVLSQGKRRSIEQIISQKGKPKAVFITSMSSNFPTAVATAIPLNHAQIPVVIGGIHVSTSPNDIDTFIRKYVPNPGLVSQVRGAGSSESLQQVLSDIDNSKVKPEYLGYQTIEDQVWGSKNVEEMEPMKMHFLKKIPIVGHALSDNFQVNAITPYLGCPYSCSFCSTSALPKEQRKFQARSPEDFIEELQSYQSNGVNLSNRYFVLLPDNLLLGGKTLEKILDKIIDKGIKISYAAQISIDVANNDNMLKKLRQSGANHFFIGLESLDLRNLEEIEKPAVKDIKSKGVSVKEYYSEQIRKIQDYGISVHGAFIFGLPFDYFHSLDDHTGVDVADFCIQNHIGLQPGSLNDLPGSKNFKESQEKGNYIYGAQGTMDYLASLCICDLTETNTKPPQSLKESPLVVAYMTYESIKRVGSTRRAVQNALYTSKISWKNPTNNGMHSIKERLLDSVCSFASQLIVSQYKDHAEALAHSNAQVKGGFERLYNSEKNLQIKEIFSEFVKDFKHE